QLIEKEVEAQVRLTLDLLPTRPVLGNSARLAQVVLNLVVNATQALSDHNEGKIMIRTFEDDDHAVVEVSDNGPGVQADVRDRIFEPFISTKDVGAGTGLGLFVSRNIARNLGGDLIVYEHPGGGATFRVTLPCYKGPLPEDTSRLPASPIAEGASEAILVVDDDERVGAVLCARLESAGYRARRVQTGEEALELLLEQRI